MLWFKLAPTIGQQIGEVPHGFGWAVPHPGHIPIVHIMSLVVRDISSINVCSKATTCSLDGHFGFALAPLSMVQIPYSFRIQEYPNILGCRVLTLFSAVYGCGGGIWSAGLLCHFRESMCKDYRSSNFYAL